MTDRLTYEEWLAKVPEGCTPTDAKVLREGNHALATQLNEIQRAANRLLIALDKEAVATLSLRIAQENYSDLEPERQHSVRAMVEASEASKALKTLVEGKP